MAEKPVCVIMNGDTKVDIQGSTTGPKQQKLSLTESTRTDDQETSKTLTEINQEDAVVSELNSSASEVLRIQNGRLICENPTANNEVEFVATQVSVSESQVLDFSKQNIDATVNITIDPSLLESAHCSDTTIIPVIGTELNEEQPAVVSTVVCEDSETVISNQANPEVTGTTGTDSRLVEIHNVSPVDTVVLETSDDVVPFQIVTDDKTEIREGEAVNVINIPETGENVSAGFALVGDLISTEDLVTMTADHSVAVTTTASSGSGAPIVTVRESDGFEPKQTITQVEANNINADETSTAVTILNATQATESPPMLEAAAATNDASAKLSTNKNAAAVTEIDLGMASSASGALQLNIASLAENLPTTTQPGQQIVYMVTSRDKTTGIRQYRKKKEKGSKIKNY